jgi:hypothetical protein
MPSQSAYFLRLKKNWLTATEAAIAAYLGISRQNVDAYWALVEHCLHLLDILRSSLESQAVRILSLNQYFSLSLKAEISQRGSFSSRADGSTRSN